MPVKCLPSASRVYHTHIYVALWLNVNYLTTPNAHCALSYTVRIMRAAQLKNVRSITALVSELNLERKVIKVSQLIIIYCLNLIL